MDENRYERIEVRLSALETEVRRLGVGAGVPSLGAPRRAAASAANPEVSVTGTAPPSAPTPPAKRLETLVAGRGLQIAGLVLVLLGAAFFLDLAFTRNWVGPAERIALGLVAGSGLVLFAATRIHGSYRALAESLLGLGAGILYLSLWASVARFPELHVSRSAAFVAMIAVTAVLGTLAGVRRSQTIAILGILGGFLTPALLADGPPDRIVLASYLLTLCAGMLVVARRYQFAALELLAALGALLYASSFSPDPMAGWSVRAAQVVAAGFFAVFAIAFTVGTPKTGLSSKRRLA